MIELSCYDFVVFVKALAIGAQMKIAHKLRSAEHISKVTHSLNKCNEFNMIYIIRLFEQRELKNVLQGSLKATEFEVK